MKNLPNFDAKSQPEKIQAQNAHNAFSEIMRKEKLAIMTRGNYDLLKCKDLECMALMTYSPMLFQSRVGSNFNPVFERKI